MDVNTSTLRERQKLQTRLEIIRAGVDLFLERGVDQVPVETICERAGVSRATFFNYFPQKDLILAELVLSRVEHVRGVVEQHSERKEPPTLAEIIEILVNFGAENESLGAAGKQVFIQMLLRPACHTAHLALRGQMIALLTQLVQQTKDAGMLKRTGHSAGTVAETLFALYIATSFEWLIDPNLLQGWLTKTLQTRLDVALKGIQP